MSAQSVEITNGEGGSPYILICDHASNRVPPPFGTLGLSPADLTSHIAWDPGALAVSRHLSAALNAPLVASTVSRLVIDCNRRLDAPDLILEVSASEKRIVPANQNLSADQRATRVDLAWRPFHQAISALIERRVAQRRQAWLVSIHSFTPVFKGVSRPWEIGIIHDEDVRLAAPLIAALEADADLTVGINEPYSPADGVYFTLGKHAHARGLPSAMIEIRNDEIGDDAGQRAWAKRLATIFSNLEPGMGRMVPGSRLAGQPAP